MNSSCQCVYPRSSLMSNDQRIVVAVLNSVIGCVSLLINAVTLMAMVQTNVCRYFRLMLFVIISNLIIASLVQPLFTATLFSEHCILRWITQSILYFFLNIYCLFIAAVALDRYFVLRFPQANTQSQSKRRTKLLTGLTFIVSLLKLAACVISTFFRSGPFIFAMMAVVIDMVIINTVVILYMWIYKGVAQQTRQSNLYGVSKKHEVAEQKSDTSISTSQHEMNNKADEHAKHNGPKVVMDNVTKRSKILKPNRRLLKLTLLIIVSLYICYGPYIVLGSWWAYENTYSSKKPRRNWLSNNGVFWVFIPVFINGLLNASIYILGYKPIQRYLLHSFCCWCKKNDTETRKTDLNHTKSTYRRSPSVPVDLNEHPSDTCRDAQSKGYNSE